MGMVAPALYTAAMLRALPDDGKRYEVVSGELLVTPAPRRVHQRAVGELGFLLRTGLQLVRDVEVLHSPADIELEERTLVQPDLFVTRRAPGEESFSWKAIDLVLVIEVLSATTARYDRLTKRILYQRHGVEYWIVDLDGRVVERWRPGDERPDIVAGTLEWQVPGSEQVCSINLEAFFSSVLS
ncbi:MAG: Uma2 family endonuclease [Gemmatimonadota bacterium]